MALIKDILYSASLEISKGTGSEVANREAEILFEYVTGFTREKVYINLYKPFPLNYLALYLETVRERASGKPLAYITGKRDFMSLEFSVNPSVLIPRPETEILVERVINIIEERKLKNPVILDIGTGSGAIALSLAKYVPTSSVYGVDISREALLVAKENAKKLNLTENVFFMEGDIFSPFENREILFDIIVSNPPYISFDESNDLSSEVIDYEPKTALFASNNGFYFFEKIASSGRDFLKRPGFLAFEVGFKQGEKVRNFLFMEKYVNILITKDLSGIDRVVTGEI